MRDGQKQSQVIDFLLLKGTEENLDQLESPKQVSLVKTVLEVVSFNYFLELIIGRRKVLEDGGSQAFSHYVEIDGLEHEDILE